MAIEDVIRQKILPEEHTLDMVVAETYGEEEESILQTAKLWTFNVSAYIGPQESCVHEARMAASFRLPMISYVSSLSSLYRVAFFVHWSTDDMLAEIVFRSIENRRLT